MSQLNEEGKFAIGCESMPYNKAMVIDNTCCVYKILNKMAKFNLNRLSERDFQFVVSISSFKNYDDFVI